MKRKRHEVKIVFDTKPATQWQEAQRLIREIREVQERNKFRLRKLLGMNQNPGCGGDGSIDEDRWYWLSAEMLKCGIGQ